jgi:protein-S-isoprenylcysteine O-methyltransferase Ste14
MINLNQTSHAQPSSKLGQKRPMFEFKGGLAKIDLSAWISGSAYLLGISVMGYPNLLTSLNQSEFDLVEISLSLLTFLAVVIIIQKHMGLTIGASEFGKPKQLSTHGPYAYSRNPIYLTFLLPLASFAFISLLAAAVSITFYITTMNLTVLRSEERDLLAIFGDSYETYAQKVNRWL